MGKAVTDSRIMRDLMTGLISGITAIAVYVLVQPMFVHPANKNDLQCGHTYHMTFKDSDLYLNIPCNLAMPRGVK